MDGDGEGTLRGAFGFLRRDDPDWARLAEERAFRFREVTPLELREFAWGLFLMLEFLAGRRLLIRAPASVGTPSWMF